MNIQLTEIERINVLLPTELFAGSKDWRVGSTADRVDWLLTMYSSAKEEVERLQSALEAQPAQQPINCRHCGGPDNVLCGGQCKEQPAQQQEQPEYCTDYHCAGDCGQPHNQKEMREFLAEDFPNCRQPVICDLRHWSHEDTTHIHPANARLIAAAPDLLEALKDALATIEDYLGYEHNGDPWTEDARSMGEMDVNDYKRDGRLVRARAAITKATGEIECKS